MTRKALNAFDPNKLKVGAARIFEVRNQTTGFREDHYFYRSQDGELFTCICRGLNEAIQLRDEWKKKKELMKILDGMENEK